MKITYWFWYDGQVVASVRMEAGTSERAAREEAMRQHKANPTIGLQIGDLPFKLENKIRNAVVQCTQYNVMYGVYRG